VVRGKGGGEVREMKEGEEAKQVREDEWGGGRSGEG
jgi:hypothetical protein